MYEKLRRNYYAMAEKHHLTLIPSGDVIQAVRATPEFNMEAAGRSLTRDGFHMSRSYGRYLLALIWAKVIFGLEASASRYVPDDEAEPVEDALLNVLRKTVDSMIG